MGWFRFKKKASKKELHRLEGLLSHCTKVMRGGRTFSRRVYILMAKVKKPFDKIRLSKGFREDMYWWQKYAQTLMAKPSSNIRGIF